jgi:energy-coupling factor transport system ATP-binding protein
VPGNLVGTLDVDGRPVATSSPADLAAIVGLVFQDPASQIVMERMGDDVAFGLENRGWPSLEMHERVPESLAETGLAGMDRGRSRESSGGQQQRLALAGVLAPRPGILVLDEPTANLDPVGAAGFFDGLHTIRTTRTATIVLVEHRVEAAWPLADLVLALGPDGEPIAFGPPDDVLERAGAQMALAGIWLPESAERWWGSGDNARVVPMSSRPAAGPRVVRARDVGYHYRHGEPVLAGVDIDAHAGERIALRGPNGSGKSTLGRLLVGLLAPDTGEVSLGGDDPARLPAVALARRAGYVFQEPERQFLTQRVGDEVGLGLSADELRTAPSLMDRLGLPLETFGERSPYRLSGGEQRRLSLACVLVRRPGLLVLDEPTFGQDRRGYDGLLAILGEHLDDGACLIAATHDPRFVADVAGRTVTLEAGRIVADEAVPER